MTRSGAWILGGQKGTGRGGHWHVPREELDRACGPANQVSRLELEVSGPEFRMNGPASWINGSAGQVSRSEIEVSGPELRVICPAGQVSGPVGQVIPPELRVIRPVGPVI